MTAMIVANATALPKHIIIDLECLPPSPASAASCTRQRIQQGTLEQLKARCFGEDDEEGEFQPINAHPAQPIRRRVRLA